MARTASSINSEVFTRLNHVERDMAAMAIQLESTNQILARLESGQEQLSESIAQRQRANWPVILTAAGSFLTLLVFYTGMVSGPIAERQRLHKEFFQMQLNSLSDRTMRNEERLHERIDNATADRFTRTDFERWLDRNEGAGR